MATGAIGIPRLLAYLSGSATPTQFGKSIGGTRETRFRIYADGGAVHRAIGFRTQSWCRRFGHQRRSALPASAPLTESGLRKRAQWQDTWALQRREDLGESVSRIPMPPKYQSKDFLKSEFWRLRGAMDVPKERWISYPGCERGADRSLLIAWAGWNHLQQATALAAYYLEMKDNEGWDPMRLQPLLAGLLELLPWLHQWHNEIDPAYGERMGTYYKGFVAEEARALGFTLDSLKGWSPPAVSARRVRKKAVRST